MPLYEYRCKDCNTTFDTLVSHRDKANTVTCRECSSGNVRRLISTFATPGGFDDQLVASDMRGGGGCCGGSCGCSH
jgi:putative FmdB family regulatory protein